MPEASSSNRKLLVEINRLRNRLAELEGSLGAIQRGEVDALVVGGPEGDQIFTLAGAEHPYRVMVEAINEGAATLLRDGTVLYSNRQFARMLGIPLERLIGKCLPDLFPSAVRSAVQDLIQQAASGPVRCEIEIYQTSDSVLPAQLSLNPFNDSGTEAMCLVATDLSLQKKSDLQRLLAERALSAEEERHLLILSNVKDYAIFMLDPSGKVMSWDLGAQRIKGYEASEAIGKHFSCFYVPDDLETHQPEIELRTAAAEDRFETERWSMRKDGSRFWANVILTSLRDEKGKLRGFINVTRDITDRKFAEEELRRLSTRLMNLQDQERRRIARELHDSEGQNLSVLLMSLSKLKRSSHSLDLEGQALLSESIEIANQCLRDIRTLSYLLHPPLLDEFGLISALHWYVEGFSERSGIAVNLKVPPALSRLPGEMETSLFRLVQEGLTNIHRHSGSDRACISLEQDEKNLKLLIEDYGKGMDASRHNGTNGVHGSGVGIAGMRERARELGGTMYIESDKRRTLVSISLPLPAVKTAATQSA
jgi:PAS domain S-box-containing protein